MRKVIYLMNMSLDGYMEGKDGDLSWTDPDDELFRHFLELDAAIDLHFYGRGLYQNMSAYWPSADQDPSASELIKEYSRVWKRMPKVVVSKSLTQVDWNSTLLHRDLAEEVAMLKALPGKMMSVGGAGLAASFMQLGLIDEYWVYVHPAILGQGKSMFPHLPATIRLELFDSHIFGSKVAALKYKTLG